MTNPNSPSKGVRCICPSGLPLLAHSDKLSANHETFDVESTYIPKTSYSVIQFIDYYFDIRDAIVLWYKENGVDISQLNIEFRR